MAITIQNIKNSLLLFSVQRGYSSRTAQPNLFTLWFAQSAQLLILAVDSLKLGVSKYFDIWKIENFAISSVFDFDSTLIKKFRTLATQSLNTQ